MRETYLGALLCIGGNVSINTGVNLIKLGQGTDILKNQPGQIQLLIGWLLFISGNGINFVALSMAPQMLLGSLGSVQFIANLIFLGVYLGQDIRMRNIFGTLLVIAGNTVLIFDYSLRVEQRTEYSADQLYELYNRTEYKTYVVVSVLVYLLFQKFEDSNLCFRLFNESKASPRSQTWTVMSGLMFSSCSAMLGTQSLVTGKTLAVLMKNYSLGREEFFNPQDMFNISFFVMVLGAWFVFMLFWMWRLSLSLTLYDAMFIIPVNQIMWILFSVISGGIYFREFEEFQTSDVILLVSGLILVFFGVTYLVNSQDQTAGGNTSPKKPTTSSSISRAAMLRDENKNKSGSPKKFLDKWPDSWKTIEVAIQNPKLKDDDTAQKNADCSDSEERKRLLKSSPNKNSSQLNPSRLRQVN